MRAISLMYHDIVAPGMDDASGFPGVDAALYKLDRNAFEQHLRHIAAVRPNATVVEALGTRPSRPPLLFTFDDGGVSAAERTADMLEAFGWRGHFFVTAGYVGKPAFLAPGHLRNLRARGHLVGSHSWTHPLRMARCGWPRLVDEWRRSLDSLAQIVGEPVTAASVPGGDYAPIVARAAAIAGTRYLFTSEPTVRARVVDGTLVLGRFTVQRGMSATTASALATGRIPPRVRQALLWNAKKLGKAAGGRAYLKVRQYLLGHGDEVQWGDDRVLP